MYIERTMNSLYLLSTDYISLHTTVLHRTYHFYILSMDISVYQSLICNGSNKFNPKRQKKSSRQSLYIIFSTASCKETKKKVIFSVSSNTTEAHF